MQPNSQDKQLYTLFLEDHGQEFTQLDIEPVGDGIGIIRDSRPSLARVWNGMAVRMESIEVGRRPRIGAPDGVGPARPLLFAIQEVRVTGASASGRSPL